MASCSCSSGQVRRRTVTSIALFAILLQSLAGILQGSLGLAEAQAAEGSAGIAFLIICTPEGVKKIGLDGAPVEEEGDEQRPLSAGLHACQICCTTPGCSLAVIAAAAAVLNDTDSRLAWSDPDPLGQKLIHPAQPSRGPPFLV